MVWAALIYGVLVAGLVWHRPDVPLAVLRRTCRVAHAVAVPPWLRDRLAAREAAPDAVWCSCGSTTEAAEVESAGAVIGYLCPDCLEARPTPYRPPPMAVDAQPDARPSNPFALTPRAEDPQTLEEMRRDLIARFNSVEARPGGVFVMPATEHREIQDRMKRFEALKANLAAKAREAERLAALTRSLPCDHDDVEFHEVHSATGTLIRRIQSCGTCERT